MPLAVKIPPQGDRWLGFDLREVMTAVGAHHDLAWRLSGAEIVWREDVPEEWQTIEERSSDLAGVSVTWADMEKMAEDCQQVIDGRFTGCRGDEPVLSLAAIDSSYWTIWASDSAVTDRVRRAFRGVENYDESAPQR